MLCRYSLHIHKPNNIVILTTIHLQNYDVFISKKRYAIASLQIVIMAVNNLRVPISRVLSDKMYRDAVSERDQSVVLSFKF